jgi:hypothetical protein
LHLIGDGDLMKLCGAPVCGAQQAGAESEAQPELSTQSGR